MGKRGFQWYGLIGILLIILVEINFFYKIEPFASWYFPIIWAGYILTLDSIIFKLKGNSLISNRFAVFFGMVILSATFWWVFEFINLILTNWSYIGTASAALKKGVLTNFMGTLSFATVLPALFETTELICTLHLFSGQKLKNKYKMSKAFIHMMMIFGLIFLISSVALPKFAFPLVWLSFLFILDPINYLHDQPSIIRHLKDGKLAVPFALLLSGFILGFLWEFWNYWAVIKWTYDIPFLGFFKVFEMPILGYFGYFPFAFELYAMYWFSRSLFIHKEKILE